jgi:hypothetical protein
MLSFWSFLLLNMAYKNKAHENLPSCPTSQLLVNPLTHKAEIGRQSYQVRVLWHKTSGVHLHGLWCAEIIFSSVLS